MSIVLVCLILGLYYYRKELSVLIFPLQILKKACCVLEEALKSGGIRGCKRCMSSIQKGTSCFIYYQGLDRGNMKALKL
jgi:hypothetical protein